MTDKPLRRGRRDNGLEAGEYAVAADVDPRIGEHLLDVLGVARIAAYLQPTADLDPVTRSSMLPARPTDRLYVDRDHLTEAREYASRLETDDSLDDPTAVEGGTLDPFEVRWRQLVEQLESAPPRPDTGRGPAEELSTTPGDHKTLDHDRDPDSPRTDTRLPRLRSALPVADPDEPTLLDALDALDADDSLDPDDDEGFVPPVPPPLPSVSPATWWSLASIAMGFVVLLWPEAIGYIGLSGTEDTLVVAALFLVAGCVGLILRLRPGTDEDVDPDDGARV